MGNWGYNPYMWSYGPLLLADGDPLSTRLWTPTSWKWPNLHVGEGIMIGMSQLCYKEVGKECGHDENEDAPESRTTLIKRLRFFRNEGKGLHSHFMRQHGSCKKQFEWYDDMTKLYLSHPSLSLGKDPIKTIITMPTSGVANLKQNRLEKCSSCQCKTPQYSIHIYIYTWCIN